MRPLPEPASPPSSPLPPPPDAAPAPAASHAVWLFALGYFAAYVPYAALTKLLSERARIPAMELLPPTALASALGAVGVLLATCWWRQASRRVVFGRAIPWPGRWTALSGLCSAAVIATTTLAYTFRGVSIVFMVILMKASVLAIAPVVDLLGRRKIRVPSWIALGLSLAALAVSFEGAPTAMAPLAALDVAVYVLAYFVRLRLMTRLGKAEGRDTQLRYFVEEHMVASPALLLALAVLAPFGVPGLAEGFTHFWSRPEAPLGVLVGLLSEGTGVFGARVLLDARENSFSVPLNRASSVLAGVVAGSVLWAVAGMTAPSRAELIGAGVLVLAVLALTLHLPEKHPRPKA
jgi:hypothetical protein